MELPKKKLPEDAIHVTGFGLFSDFTESNPSWEAVARLPNYIDFNQQRIEIVKHEIPVSYDAVDEKVEEIWSSKPKVGQLKRKPRYSEKITCSTHPGNYLCGYIYLKSLDMDSSRSLFVHVPPVDDQFTVNVMAEGIFSVIKQCMKQLSEKE